ncbi:MAG: GyrI-like domain-containing protein [Ardenticatenaceae bacterium]|nr:GyrI-like domain-containing protein [Ardenticatenaceae bacterium]
MNITIIHKPAFAVLGIEGRGPAEKGPSWIKPLWGIARGRINEVKNLISEECWGLMSAVDEPFARWGDEGKYLAGWEAPVETQAPEGWTLWEVPETTFAKVACTMRTYRAVWHYFHNQFLPDVNYEQAGAVHEYYPPGYRDPYRDAFYLFFTVKKKEPVDKVEGSEEALLTLNS